MVDTCACALLPLLPPALSVNISTMKIFCYNSCYVIGVIFNKFTLPFKGKLELNKEIDACNNGVPKHLGQIADSMTEWEGRISEELRLKPADVASILKKHPNNLKLQS